MTDHGPRRGRHSDGCRVARPARPLDERVDALIAEMTLDEKLAQLYGVWVGASDEGGADVAPHQHEMNDDVDLDAILPTGSARSRARSARPGRRRGRRAVARAHAGAHRAANRLGIPAIVHEECLTGLRRVGRHGVPGAAVVGRDVRPGPRRADGAPHRRRHALVGVHQGLAPVLDVVRDPRWGRVEETIGEDPYLVGTVGTAYVRGLEASGRRGDAQALRRLLGVEGRAQPRARVDRRARARRRAAAAVRDGRARGRRPLGDELVHRPRRRARRRPTATLLTGAAARDVGLRRHGRRRLLRGGVPEAAARRRRATWAEAAGAALRPGSTSSCPR